MGTTGLQGEAAPRADRLPPGSRIYAVGDVHGHSDKLLAMHKAIRDDLRAHVIARPLLVHIGDLIDRGPDSSGTVALLAAGPPVPGVPTVNLMGNHEWMLLTALERQTPNAVQHWLSNGGDVALESWGIPEGTPADRWAEMMPVTHTSFLRGLAFSHVCGGYAFVHAGVRPGIRLDSQRPADLLWIREGFLDWDGVMLPEAPAVVIVHGHTPEPEPSLRANRIGIDTGAGMGHRLTCAVLERDGVRFLAT